MISEITLTNFKCFSYQSIQLSSLNILTGINGSGKSTIIQTLTLALQSENKDRLEFNGALLELGNLTDIQHELAEDNQINIRINCDEGACEWGFKDNEINIRDLERTEYLPARQASTKVLSWLKSNAVYVSAERWGPRANVPLNTHNENPFWLGKHGEYTIQFLHALSEGSIKDLSGDFVSSLNKTDPRIHESESSTTIFANIIAWMGEVSPGVSINASVVKEALVGYSTFSFNGSKQFKSSNVGFGLSYALSVVTALVSAPKNGLVILENPEAHLHPMGQSRLGQLAALASKAGVQIVIETHSEHIINGARVMIRKDLLANESLNILYAQRNTAKSVSSFTQIKANEMGQLSEWPSGFFDQQSKDMKTLITGV